MVQDHPLYSQIRLQPFPAPFVIPQSPIELHVHRRTSLALTHKHLKGNVSVAKRKDSMTQAIT